MDVACIVTTIRVGFQDRRHVSRVVQYRIGQWRCVPVIRDSNNDGMSGGETSGHLHRRRRHFIHAIRLHSGAIHSSHKPSATPLKTRSAARWRICSLFGKSLIIAANSAEGVGPFPLRMFRTAFCHRARPLPLVDKSASSPPARSHNPSSSGPPG